MTQITEGQFDYIFAPEWTASKYDEWPYYKNHLTSAFGGLKGVDLIARSPDNEVWLIECKDYRVNTRTKPIELADEIAAKVRDTLAGLVAAAKWHADHTHADEARRSLQSRKIHVVLHLEQAPKKSKTAPDLTVNLQQKLRQLVGCIDKRVRVISHQAHDLPWQIKAIPLTTLNTKADSHRKQRRGRVSALQ